MEPGNTAMKKHLKLAQDKLKLGGNPRVGGLGGIPGMGGKVMAALGQICR